MVRQEPDMPTHLMANPCMPVCPLSVTRCHRSCGVDPVPVVLGCMLCAALWFCAGCGLCVVDLFRHKRASHLTRIVQISPQVTQSNQGFSRVTGVLKYRGSGRAGSGHCVLKSHGLGRVRVKKF